MKKARKKVKPRVQPINNFNKIKGVASLYRSVGLIGSITTSILSVGWIILCASALAVLFVGPPYAKDPGKSFKQGIEKSPQDFNFATFFYYKLNEPEKYIPPIIIFELLVIYVIFSSNLLLASVFAFFEFRIWRGSRRTRRLGQYWAISTIVMCLYELMFVYLFYNDTTHKEYPQVQEKVYQLISAFMALLGMKGFIIWPFILVLAITLLILPFANRKNCPI